jgi:shikimate dehydrogenase
MGENVSPLRDGLLTADHVVVDIVYHPLKTTLLAQAESAGSRTVDGLRMLIHQAARQQSLWTGVRPDVTSMTRAAIRALG